MEPREVAILDDPFDLQRFVEAQSGVYEGALAELRAGRKRRHWMWFIFPQISGLGSSPMAHRYAISSLGEAQAYLRDGVLGDRLRACTAAVNGHSGLSARDVFGSPDDVKFRSSVTLFAEAAPGDPVFTKALDTYFGGQKDPLTIETLRSR